jgi:hypothetical protein
MLDKGSGVSDMCHPLCFILGKLLDLKKMRPDEIDALWNEAKLNLREN